MGAKVERVHTVNDSQFDVDVERTGIDNLQVSLDQNPNFDRIR